MRISKTEQAALVEELRRIAARLTGASQNTEDLAKANLALAVKVNPDAYRAATHYPHQVGGLSQICTSSASDIEAIIRRLGGGS